MGALVLLSASRTTFTPDCSIARARTDDVFRWCGEPCMIGRFRETRIIFYVGHVEALTGICWPSALSDVNPFSDIRSPVCVWH